MYQKPIIEGFAAVIGVNYDYGDEVAGVSVAEEADELETAIEHRENDIAELKARLDSAVEEFIRLQSLITSWRKLETTVAESAD
jgi:hypothetical protein